MLDNNIPIKKIFTIINIKDINNRKHNVSEYIRLKLFFYKLAIALIEREFHIVNNLTAIAFIDINIIKLKKVSLNFNNDIAIFKCYDNTSIFIKIYSYSK